MKIKIFSSITSTDDLENQIAEWTNDFKPIIHKTEINAVEMKDYYPPDHAIVPNGICNHWIEYTMVIVYELKSIEYSTTQINL